MPRRGLPSDLNAVRALVAEGRSRVSAAGLFTVADRLDVVDTLLVRATGGLSRWTRVVLTVLTAAALTGLVTLLGAELGLNALGLVPLALVTQALGGGLATRLLGPLDSALNRRRLSRALRLPATSCGPGLREPLIQARIRLVSTALRRTDSRRWRSPYLRVLVGDEPAMGLLAEADLMLCEAVDRLEVLLSDRAKDTE